MAPNKTRMKHPILYLLLFFTLTRTATNAQQQDPQWSLFMFNPLFNNPAAAGTADMTRTQLMYRTQYAGYQASFDDGGAATTQLIAVDVPLASIRGGLGLHILNDRIGPSGLRQYQLSYAYKTVLNRGNLNFGARVGLTELSLDYNFRYNDKDDPLLVGRTGRVTETKPTIGLGVFYDTDNYYIGASVSNLNQPRFETGSLFRPNAYLQFGYFYDISYNIQLQPVALVRFLPNNLKTVTFDAGVLASFFENKIFAGATYRLQDAVVAIAGVNLLDNRLKISAAYDFVQPKEVKTPQSFEFMIGYNFNAPRFGKKSIVRTPRFRY